MCPPRRARVARRPVKKPTGRAAGVRFRDIDGGSRAGKPRGCHGIRVAHAPGVHMGIATAEISTISYGSQRPKDPGHGDSAHAQNGHDDLVIR